PLCPAGGLMPAAAIWGGRANCAGWRGADLATPRPRLRSVIASVCRCLPYINPLLNGFPSCGCGYEPQATPIALRKRHDTSRLVIVSTACVNDLRDNLHTKHPAGGGCCVGGRRG